jgi:ketosteroid isomerase-like protein
MSESIDVVRRAYEAFHDRDLGTLKEISDPEIKISSVTGILSGRETPYQGIEALADYVRDVSTTWDEIELVPEEFHELEDNRVLVFGRVRASRRHSEIDTPNAWLWTLRDGRVVSVQVYAEPTTDARWLFK